MVSEQQISNMTSDWLAAYCQPIRIHFRNAISFFSRSISMDEAKEHIFPVIENKHKLSNTLRDANANKSRTMASPPLAPANAWGEKSESTSRPNSGDNIPQGIADGKMFAPKPPEKPKGTRQLSPKGQFSPRDRPASSSTYLTEGREDGVTNGWHEQLGKASRAEADMERSAHIETNRSLELSEETVSGTCHDDVIKWKHFPHYWPFIWLLMASLGHYVLNADLP